MCGLNPLRSENNLQHVGKVPWYEYNTLHNPSLLDRQLAYAVKIIEETSPYDNVYYEICNEPGGNANPAATTADVDAWQAKIAEVVRQELKRLGRKHLIFGSQAFSYSPSFRQELDRSFAGKLVDAVTVHPLPGMVLGGREYMLGHFMSKEFALKDFRDFCRASQAFAKPCVPDEDNAASMYRDETGWTIHRKRAWTSVLSLCHYDYIDFSITVGSETGTHASNRLIRTWIKHLSDFVSTLDVVHARVAADWILRKPPHLIDSASPFREGEFVAYLADDREVTDPEAGHMISGDLSIRLPEGRYLASFYSPTAGLYSPAIPVQGDPKEVTLHLPPIEQDIVLVVKREP